MEAAAQAAGLVYAHLPVQGGYQSPEEIAQCAALLEGLAAPVADVLPQRRTLDQAVPASDLARRLKRVTAERT